MRRLNEKIAVVTGANGNGQALAKRLPVDVAAVAAADAGAIISSATRGAVGPPPVTSLAGGVAENWPIAKPREHFSRVLRRL